MDNNSPSMDTSLSKLQETVEDRGAWCPQSMRLQRDTTVSETEQQNKIQIPGVKRFVSPHRELSLWCKELTELSKSSRESLRSACKQSHSLPAQLPGAAPSLHTTSTLVLCP